MEFRILAYIAGLLIVLLSCTKEVQIDIPGYEEQLVIDGRIETNFPPIIFLTKSQEVYASTSLDDFLNGFQTGAEVTVSNGTETVILDEICSDNLPPGSETIVANMLGIPESELVNYHICAYTTLNTAIWGEVGKTYDLTVKFEGKTYTASTDIVPPTPLNYLFWKPDGDNTNNGYSWANLSDPPNQYDTYFWEVRRIDKDSTGSDMDPSFTPTYSPVFDDEFFDGLTFDFWYENPYRPNGPDTMRYMFSLGDSIAIKFSKMDRDVYEFFYKKYVQLSTAGNPFATPTNIPTNIQGGALGIWAGFSPSIDTLICLP